MNEYEMLRLIKVNEDCPPEAFDFNTWGEQADESPCGTVACLCGNWLLQNGSHQGELAPEIMSDGGLIHSFLEDNGEPGKPASGFAYGELEFNEDEAREALGISREEYDYLFFNSVQFAKLFLNNRHPAGPGSTYPSYRYVSSEGGLAPPPEAKDIHIRRVKLFFHYKMKKAAMWQAWIDDHEKKQVECDNACLKAAELVNAE